MTNTPSTAALHRLLDAELSLPARLGHVALLLMASMITVVIGALWITEPALPGRVQAAFAVMIAIGLSWVSFSAWVLTERRPLLARHRIVAGRMAVTFSVLFVAGALAVGRTEEGAASYVAASVGVAMLAAAIILLVRAHRGFARLAERRRALEHELGKRPA